MTTRTKIKFEILQGVMENIFFSNAQKEEFINSFCRVQYIYHAFAKFGRICKIKLSSTKNEEDLFMTPINKMAKDVILIYQNGANYLFVAKDLINIINKSLSNNVNYFCEALQVKNPYTNLPFSKAILCNIYFFIKRIGIPTPILFHLYFVSGFDINKFTIDNEGLLRDTYIYNYVHNTPASFLYNTAVIMIYLNKHARKWIVSEDVNKEEFVKIMQPYLYLHELSKYSLNNDKKHISGFELNSKLKRFYEFNPLFGRKIVTPRTNGTIVTPYVPASITINMVHPPFHEKTRLSISAWQNDDKLYNEGSMEGSVGGSAHNNEGGEGGEGGEDSEESEESEYDDN